MYGGGVNDAFVAKISGLGTPSPQCTLSASPSTISLGGSATLTATCSPAATSYTWTPAAGLVAGPANTATVTPVAAGVYQYSVTGSNAGGAGNIASTSVTVTVASCTYSLPATSQSVAANANTGTLNVTSASGCAWSASSNVAWITITSGGSGSGSGTVAYAVAANSGSSSRVGTLAIAGQTFTVTQAGQAVPACTLSASPSTITAGQSSTLTATCSPAATSYAWTNTGFAATASGGTVSLTVTTTYSVMGSNAAGSGNTASATVTVPTAVAGATPDTGMWWNPNQAGRGFSIEVQGNSLFLGAFLYDTSGRSTWYASGGGIQSDGTYSGVLQSYGNGQTLTGAYKASTVTNPNAGNVTIKFTDATHGTLTWPGGSVAIERFVFDSATPSFKPETGMWWNQAESGRGFLIEVQGTTLWMGGYMYDGAGNSVWYSTAGPMTSTTLYQGHWDQYSGGQTLTGAYKAPDAPTNAGTIKLQFNTSSTATLTLPDGRQIQLERFYFGPVGSKIVTYTYDSKDQLIRAEYGGGNAVSYSYDASGNPATITATGTGSVTDR
ncbi:MAG: hypothetical protein A3G25_08040 [Betaproteobacteria bacterium RIFCSPLOWO2_12_FULL_63_13]|nr:MAG: hypothetical protein A3G25_08040 [Betaproteobacteria bacterium RIFCSPLOWO2_12_FULL_63_13]